MAADGIFQVHRLASPITETAEIRLELLIESLAQLPGDQLSRSPDVEALLDQGLVGPWQGATAVLDELGPSRVLIAGHREVGALAALDRHDPEVPVTLLALGTDPASLAFPHFDKMFDRSDSVITVTEAERTAVVDHHGRPEAVHRVGAPLGANPSALSEPNTWVGETDYVLVLTGVDEEADTEENELARLLRTRFPENPVGVSHNDAFCAWRHGQVTRGWPIERSSDLDRLMAWARVTVDLHPGRFFARRCVTSLLFGTPIVVPEASRAREHAERGKGGLWFANAAELVWSVEALLDQKTRAAFSTQGLSYAEEEYGSTDRFIERVTSACGLATDRSAPVRAGGAVAT